MTSKPASETDLQALFDRGRSEHQRGNLAAAVQAYDQILAVLPDQADTLYLRGTVDLQSGHHAEALRRLEAALAARPDHAASHINRAAALIALARFAEAAAAGAEALRLNPRSVVALGNQAFALNRLGRPMEALAFAEQALALTPGDAKARLSHAEALRALGRLGEALASCEKARAFGSEPAELANSRGVILLELERTAEALVALERAAALDPKLAGVHANRGNALFSLRRFDEAIAAYGQALSADPTNADAACKQATALNVNQRWGEALKSADQALGLRKDYPAALVERARALEALSRPAEALAACNAALALKPDAGEARFLKAACLTALKSYEEALAEFEALLAREPDLAIVPGEALHLAMRICRWDRWPQTLNSVLAALDAGKAAAQPLTLLATPATARQLHASATQSFKRAATDAYAWPRTAKDTGGKIRLGYFSSDFVDDHPVGKLIAGVLTAHDRARFEVIGFAIGSHGPRLGRQKVVDALDRLIDVSALSDAETVARARTEGLDIAIDLNGCTGGARSQLFDRGVAPVQVNYLGYAGTMGSSCHHYIVADYTVIPAEDRTFFSEHVVFMPGCYLPGARVEAGQRPDRAALGLPRTGFVFCSFNGCHKITPDAFDIWMRLLSQIEGSVLWLAADNAAAMRNLKAEAQKRGVAPARLVFAPHVSRADHMARHLAADLFLDTFYFNAHSTAIDALAMDLPVVTRRGPSFAGRVAASVLNAAGLPELIAEDSAQYEAMALALASESARLRATRDRIATVRSGSTLFDTVRYTRNLEFAYGQMWTAHTAGTPREDIIIKDDGAA